MILLLKAHPATQGVERRPREAVQRLVVLGHGRGDQLLAPGEPTPAEAADGAYNKPTVQWRGLTIRVENPAGSVRRGTNRHGVTWEQRMAFDYGEIAGSMGVDGDPVDVFIGPDPEAQFVYIVHQRKVNRWDEYDEDKVMADFSSEDDARAAFLASYSDPRFLGPTTTMPVDEFIAKVRATRERPAMIKCHVLFLKSRGNRDTATGDLFGSTHVETRTRSDGVVQTYHVSSQHPEEGTKLDTKPANERADSSGESKVSHTVPAESKRDQTMDDPTMPVGAKVVTRDFVVKKVGRKWLTVTAPGKNFEMQLQLCSATEHYKAGGTIKQILVGEVREENRYGVKLTYYVPSQREVQRHNEEQAQAADVRRMQAADVRRKAEIDRWLGYVEDKASQGWLYENGLAKLRELGANSDPAVKKRIDGAVNKVAETKAERQRQYANERAVQRSETVSRRILFPLQSLPLLNRPVRFGNQVVVLTGTGQTFRISNEHPSLFGSHLLGHEGDKGAYAYYRPASPDEVAELEKQEAEEKAEGRQRHWGHSQDAVSRALRGED